MIARAAARVELVPAHNLDLHLIVELPTPHVLHERFQALLLLLTPAANIARVAFTDGGCTQKRHPGVAHIRRHITRQEWFTVTSEQSLTSKSEALASSIPRILLVEIPLMLRDALRHSEEREVGCVERD